MIFPLNEEIYELVGKKVRFELYYRHMRLPSNIVEGRVVGVRYDERSQDLSIALDDVGKGARRIFIMMQDVKAYEVKEE